MTLQEIDKEIHNCNLCKDMVEKFPNSKTVSIGKNNDILILGEAPANNGWRKSGIAWYDINNKLLPSGVVLQKLLDIVDIKLEETYFLEAIKCYPIDRKYLKLCNNNCKQYLLKQLEIINPKIILMDEPLSALDGDTRNEMQKLILNIHERTGNTILMVTHSIEEANKMCDEIIKI